MSHKELSSSWRSILSVTAPITFTMLSQHLLFVIDRLMLLNYSIDAMNAVAASSNLLAVLNFFFSGLAGTAEIYVGQFNGAKQYRMLAQPSWQMFYASLLSLLIFLPLGYWAQYLNLLPAHYLEAGVNYQRIVMYGGPLTIISMALASFFIGQGRTLLVTIATIAGTASNVVLDYLLIYGAEGWWPAYGEKGAAYATVIAQLINIIILTTIFFSRANRKSFDTARPRWLPSLFKNIIRLGLPVACNESMALMSWFLVLSMITHTSKELTTIYTMEINIYMLMIFMGDGLCKGSAAINSNLIGQGQLKAIRQVVRRLMILAIATVTISALVLAVSRGWLLSLCDQEFLTILARNEPSVENSLALLFLLVQFETLLSILWGALIAGGDTYFATLCYQSCLWIGMVLPIAALFFAGKLYTIEQPFLFSLCWSSGTVICYWLRYRGTRWCHKLI